MEMVFLPSLMRMFESSFEKSFNPCFDGNGLLAIASACSHISLVCFNPCFDGNGLLAEERWGYL